MLPYQWMQVGMVYYPIFSLLPERRRAQTRHLSCRVNVIPSLSLQFIQLQFPSEFVRNGVCERRESYCPKAPYTVVVSTPSAACRCESPGYVPPAGSGLQACRTLLSPSYLFTNQQQLLQKTTPMGLDIAKPMPVAQEVFARSSATLGTHPVSRCLLTSSIQIPLASSYTDRGTKCFKDVLRISDCLPSETIGTGFQGQGCMCVAKNSTVVAAQPCAPMVSFSFYLSVQCLVWFISSSRKLGSMYNTSSILTVDSPHRANNPRGEFQVWCSFYGCEFPDHYFSAKVTWRANSIPRLTANVACK